MYEFMFFCLNPLTKIVRSVLTLCLLEKKSVSSRYVAHKPKTCTNESLTETTIFEIALKFLCSIRRKMTLEDVLLLPTFSHVHTYVDCLRRRRRKMQ